MQKKMKQIVALVIAGVVFLSNLSIDGAVMQVEAAEELAVEFDHSYAEAGKELSAIVTTEEEVTYQWSVGGSIIENNTNCRI